MKADNHGHLDLLFEAVSRGGPGTNDPEMSTKPNKTSSSPESSETDSTETRSRSPSKDSSISSDAEGDEESSLLNQNGFTKTFPQRLFEVLNKPETDNALTWTPDGLSFLIVSPKALVQAVFPQHFKTTKFTSFTRKLNRWGFKRMTKGMNAGAYFHKLFRRDNPDLCLQMFCQKGETDRLRASVGYGLWPPFARGPPYFPDTTALSLLRERELEAARSILDPTRINDWSHPTLANTNPYGSSMLGPFPNASAASRLQAANLELGLDRRLQRGVSDTMPLSPLEAMSQNTLATHNLASINRQAVLNSIFSTQVGGSAPTSPAYNSSMQNPLRQQSLPPSPLVTHGTAAAARLMEMEQRQCALQQQQQHLSTGSPVSLDLDFTDKNDLSLDMFAALGQLRPHSVSPQTAAAAASGASIGNPNSIYANQNELLRAITGVSLIDGQHQVDAIGAPLHKYARQA